MMNAAQQFRDESYDAYLPEDEATSARKGIEALFEMTPGIGCSHHGHDEAYDAHFWVVRIGGSQMTLTDVQAELVATTGMAVQAAMQTAVR